MKAKRLGLAVGLSAGLVLSSCNDGGDGKKFLTGPQTGTVTVQLDGSNGIQFTQPSQIKTSGTADYDDAADTVTISLTLTNGSKSVLHNVKAILTNVSEGTVMGDGTFPVSSAEGGAPPYVYFGPESLAPGGTATADVVVIGVTGAGIELTMDVDVRVHPWLILPGGPSGVVATDSSGSGESVFLAPLTQALGFAGTSWSSADAKSPDGRYVYYTLRNQPAIVTYDTVEMTFTIGASYMGGTIAHDGSGVVGHIDGLTPSRDGQFVFAVLNHGTHTWPYGGFGDGGSELSVPDRIEVLKLRATDLAVVERVTIWEPSPGPGPHDVRGRRMTLNPDGTRGAVPIINANIVALIDTSNMMAIDADPEAAGLQHFTTFFLRSRIAVPNADASKIFVTANGMNDGTLEVLDVAAHEVTPLAPPTLTASTNQPTFLEWGPDGRLYYGRSYDGTVPGLSIWDGVSWVEIDGDMTAITFRGDAYYVWDDDAGEVRSFDYTDLEQSFEATETPGLPNGDEKWGHGLVLTDAS